MEYTIRNHRLTAAVRSKGAELGSIKKDGIEYVWEADPTHWQRSAPILFPIVGRLKDGKTTIEGKTYEMPGHGFLNEREFSLHSQSESEVTLFTESDPGTLAMYPYAFRFFVTFSLKEDSLSVTYRVENPSETGMDFTVGGHPGFRCPLEPEKGEQFSDFDLIFPQPIVGDCPYVSKGVIMTKHRRRMLDNETTLPLHQGLFHSDALIFEDLPQRTVTIRSRKSGHGVRMDFPDFPRIGVWSPISMIAPFVCLEPWVGMGVTEEEETGDFLEKTGILHLEGGSTASFTHTITVF